MAVSEQAGDSSTDDNYAYNHPTSIEEKDLIFNFDQKVSGTGFFSIYKYTSMPDVLGTEGRLFNGVEGKNKAHGSGNINKDSKMYAESTYANKSWINGAINESGVVIQDEEDSSSIVQLNEDGNTSYSPTVMTVGSQYYNLHPITFNSLLNEEDWIKNRDGLNSLYHKVDEAHGLDIALDAQSDNTITNMNVDENLINGRAHFGALQLEEIPVDDSEESSALGSAMKAWQKSSVFLDEDYIGTFHLRKNMTLYTHSEENEKEEDWLPCCSGGWDDMPDYDKFSYGKSAKSIFDCTCFNVPRQAQFPRSYGES